MTAGNARAAFGRASQRRHSSISSAKQGTTGGTRRAHDKTWEEHGKRRGDLDVLYAAPVRGLYWERDERWDFTSAALKGSSFYKLPRIPNYNLERCHKSDPLFRDIKPLTFFASLKALTFRLWDEPRGKLVGFRSLRKKRGP